MIVIDASAMIEALVGRDADDELLDALHTSVHAPHLLDVEVLSVLRGLALGGKLTPDAADQARADYFALSIARYELHGLADRVWQLRHTHTAYDACYLALAEALEAPLYTCDRKLAGAGTTPDVLVVPRTHWRGSPGRGTWIPPAREVAALIAGPPWGYDHENATKHRVRGRGVGRELRDHRAGLDGDRRGFPVRPGQSGLDRPPA